MLRGNMDYNSTYQKRIESAWKDKISVTQGVSPTVNYNNFEAFINNQMGSGAKPVEKETGFSTTPLEVVAEPPIDEPEKEEFVEIIESSSQT